jgi:hypothetical protein
MPGSRVLGFGDFLSCLSTGVEINGPLPSRLAKFMPGQAACRTGVAARAWPEAPGQASPGSKNTVPCRVRTGSKWRAFVRDLGLWAFWTSIIVG